MIRQLKWPAIVLSIVLVVLLIVPATRLILLGWASSEPCSGLLPLRYYLDRLNDSDKSVQRNAIEAIYKSRECATAATPAVAARIRKWRQEKEPVSGGLILEMTLGLQRMKDPPLRECSPVLVELLLCETTGDGDKYEIFALLSNYKERDPELTDALCTTIWSGFVYMSGGSAKVLNNIDHDRLKKELVKMLQSSDKYQPHTASEFVQQYCPDLEEAVPQLEKLCKTADAYTASAACKALRTVEEYQKKRR
jgi:hypothetical protein